MTEEKLVLLVKVETVAKIFDLQSTNEDGGSSAMSILLFFLCA